MEFEVNLDLLIKPELGCFVEIKRSSWSRQEARTAAPMVSELLQLLGVSPKQATRQEYVEMAAFRNSVK